jgi:hypothetical protein
MDDEARAASQQALLRHMTKPRDGDFEHPDLSGLPCDAFSNDVEDHPMRVREAARRLVFKLDRAKLEEVAGIPVSDEMMAEFVTAAAGFSLKFRIPHDETLSEQDWQRILDNPRGVDQDVRRSFMRAILEAWQRGGGNANNVTRRNIHDAGDTAQVPNGPVTNVAALLLRSLSTSDAATSEFVLHHDLAFIIDGRERHPR